MCIRDSDKLGGTVVLIQDKVGRIETSDAAQTAALQAISETGAMTRDELRAYRQESKADLQGLTSQILGEMSAKRKDDAKASMRVLGIIGAIVTTVTGLGTWYVTGSLPDRAVSHPPGIEAAP